MSVSERHRRERDARRQAILSAAMRVFAENGVEGATVEMVARRAEVAVGTIYLYFSSRDDLFLSLIAERAERLRLRYREIKARALSPREELRAVAGAYLDYLRESRGLFVAQLSVAYPRMYRRLKRQAERERYNRVMGLSQEVFGLWEDSVARLYRGAGALERARAAAAIWAGLNGAFLLTDHSGVLQKVTGLTGDDFIEEVFDFMLTAAGAAREAGNGHAGRAPNAALSPAKANGAGRRRGSVAAGLRVKGPVRGRARAEAKRDAGSLEPNARIKIEETAAALI